MSAKTGQMTGILLAGGQSRRMGRDKRLLDLGGQSLLDRSLTVLEGLFSEIIISVAEPVPQLAGLRHQVMTDLIPGAATLGGLYTGLFAARHSHIFAAACDMPFLNSTVIQRLANMHEDHDVVMVRLPGGLQPMHAIYSKACLPLLECMIRERNFKIQSLIDSKELSVRLVEGDIFKDVDPHLLTFMNVNTPADLEFARKLLGQKGGGGEAAR